MLPTNLGVLFSGGKDSTFALHKAAEKDDIACLITILSKNKESYMFHTPNIEISALQSEALGIPLITKITEGKKEVELSDLEDAIAEAIRKFKIEGLVTGAIESVYQSKRIQAICDKLKIACVNPLWKKNQKELLEELVAEKFQIVISGIFAYPLDKTWLGKEINKDTIDRLVQLSKEFGISISGEGGEIETTVLDAPMFKKKIKILESSIEASGNSGVFLIKKAKLIPK